MVRQVAGENFDVVRILEVKLIQGGMRAGDDDEFVGTPEEVLRYGLADAWKVWLDTAHLFYFEFESRGVCIFLLNRKRR